ncbi:MAG: TIGR01777 family oxidoreductase [Verrucomicrobia bacterium]|nr:TIGR01777 family oxidoreductase [Verrucomicrobiota bacterium]MBS0646099.1 TIGR01777 family oxidoreductase [Verrucomicrobiota bacterium]
MKIIIAGARGFIGKYLQEYFAEHQLVLLTRHPSCNEHYWNPEQGVLDPQLVEDVDVVINLAGEGIAGRWSQAKLRRIAQSRYQATSLLVRTLAQHAKVKVYLGASALGYYGADRGSIELDETSCSGEGVLAPICQHWEDLHMSLPNTRVIVARFGLVLGQGGFLKKLLPVFRWGMGGIWGDGRQWMSWVAIQDVCQILKFCIDNPAVTGPVNVTSPQPVTNLEWTWILAQVLHRPACLRLPKHMLRALLGASSELLLGSLRVYPKKLLDEGYRFSQPSLEAALKTLVDL